MQPLRNLLQQHVWDRVGWKAKPCIAKAPQQARDGGALAADVEALRAQLGSVVGLHSNEERAAAMQFSHELPVVVDFTAEWCAQNLSTGQPTCSSPACKAEAPPLRPVRTLRPRCGPCQKIAPFFAELCGNHAAKALFVKARGSLMRPGSCGPSPIVVRPGCRWMWTSLTRS